MKTKHSSNLMSDLTSNQLLDEAYKHVYTRRQNDTHNSDIWALSLHWPALCNEISDQLLKGYCPLSPLMGGLWLEPADDSIKQDTRTYYVPYRDDWVILTKTRHPLRCVVRQMHPIMARLKFKLALGKTFIGKIRAGFDFLGYCFSNQGMIGLARKTVINFTQRLSRLSESGAPSQRVAQ